MHDTAYEIGRAFLEVYWTDASRSILDVGSRDVNGTLRDFRPDGADYVGVDLEPGPGVDVVLEDPTSYPFDDASFDVVLSTSSFEHDRMFWLTFAEMERVLRPGGYLYINAPSNGNYHSYPYDNWRFYPDAGVALEAWAERLGLHMSLVESFTARRRSDIWSDFVMVFVKGDRSEARRATYLCDRFPDSFNVRRVSEESIANFCQVPEDLQRVQEHEGCLARQEALEREAEQLRQRLKGLEARIAELSSHRSFRLAHALRFVSSWFRSG